MMSVTEAGTQGGATPPDDEADDMVVPDAIVVCTELIDRIDRFVRATPYLKTEINTETGVDEVHPGSFAIANLNRLRSTLLTAYGTEMWNAALEGNRFTTTRPKP